MRIFEKIGAQTARAQDGVAIYAVDMNTKRYERPDKYCDLYQGSGMDKTGARYSTIDMQGPLRKGSHGPLRQGIFWTLPDGSHQRVTEDEKQEMIQDFEAAYRVLGGRVLCLVD